MSYLEPQKPIEFADLNDTCKFFDSNTITDLMQKIKNIKENAVKTVE